MRQLALIAIAACGSTDVQWTARSPDEPRLVQRAASAGNEKENCPVLGEIRVEGEPGVAKESLVTAAAAHGGTHFVLLDDEIDRDHEVHHGGRGRATYATQTTTRVLRARVLRCTDR